MGYFTFNGISSENFHIRIAAPPNYTIPNKNYIFTHIPGRNGDLVFDQGDYANVQREYQISFPLEEYALQHSMAPRDAFLTLSRDISAWLFSNSGYFELSDSYEPDVYRVATIDPSGFELVNYLDQAGAGSIKFNCKPERYLVSGKNSVAMSGTTLTLNNPTAFESDPKITITGTNTASFSVNSDNDISVTGLQTGAIVIDCARQEVYYRDSGANANDKVTFPNGFPALKPGSNIIKRPTNAGTISIVPNWWTL